MATTLNQRNLSGLLSVFPDFLTFNGNFSRKLERSGFMPLSLEFIGESHGARLFSLMHTYVQNGDLMRDPDIEFFVRNDELFTVSYRQDGFGIMQVFAPNSPAAIKTDKFLAQWLKNIKSQGFKSEPLCPVTFPPVGDAAIDAMTDDELLTALDVKPATPMTPAQLYRKAGEVLGGAPKKATESPRPVKAWKAFRPARPVKKSARLDVPGIRFAR